MLADLLKSRRLVSGFDVVSGGVHWGKDFEVAQDRLGYFSLIWDKSALFQEKLFKHFIELGYLSMDFFCCYIII